MWYSVLAIVYGAIVLLLVWRNSVLCNRDRAELLKSKGIKTDFSSFIPLILRDSLLFPFLILWYGLYAWFKALE